MPVMTQKRPRLVIEMDEGEEILRRAVNLRAAAAGISPSDVMKALIRTEFKPEIEYIQAHPTAGEGGGSRRGRKPKPPPSESDN
jgi:hypothetical protein